MSYVDVELKRLHVALKRMGKTELQRSYAVMQAQINAFVSLCIDNDVFTSTEHKTALIKKIDKMIDSHSRDSVA